MAKTWFEGWYYKQSTGDYALAFIPGKAAGGAFIQMIDSGGTRHFDMPDFYQKGDTIITGDCVFSKKGVSVNLPGVHGKLTYGKNTPLKSDIMGPFSHFRMQCRHGVISMYHTVDGSITVDNETHVFENGSGYAEKDSGYSFPSTYLWLQCNEFNEPCYFMLSIAKIPFLCLSFTGCICALMYGGKEYRFATYNGVKIIKFDENEIVLQQGDLKLEVNFRPLDKGHPLLAPKKGKMTETIRESSSAYLSLSLTKNGRKIIQCESSRAMYEKR